MGKSLRSWRSPKPAAPTTPSGAPAAIPAWRKFELSTYAEYGLTE